MDIQVSKHARKRFRERYRLYFHKSYFYSNELTDNLIYSLLTKSVKIDDWKRCPFYKNKVESIYGQTDVYKVTSPTTMYLIVDKNINIVRTVQHTFNPSTMKFQN